MNKDNAKDYLPLVQALAEGKVIQQYTINDSPQYLSRQYLWEDIKDPSFVLEPNFYRIKPEPRKAWVWWRPESMGGLPALAESKPVAENWVVLHGGHITEVTDDD